jgi:hypothetical protein
MTDNSVTTRISGDAQVAGISRNRFLGLLRRSDFSGRRKKPELLPLNAADCACSRPLTKNRDEETITINRPGRSTYPAEKSVLTSGATPVKAIEEMFTAFRTDNEQRFQKISAPDFYCVRRRHVV